MLILQNYFNCCALRSIGSKIECLKHGEAELVGIVVWADLLVTSRSCAALVLVQMYVADKTVSHLAWLDVAVLLRRECK